MPVRDDRIGPKVPPSGLHHSGTKVVDASTADIVEGDADEEIPSFACPWKQAQAFKPVELPRVRDMGGSADDEHAPALVIDAVGTIDFDGHDGVARDPVEVSTPPCANQDGIPHHRIVDGKDHRTPLNSASHPTDSLPAQELHALNSVEDLKMCIGSGPAHLATLHPSREVMPGRFILERSRSAGHLS